MTLQQLNRQVEKTDRPTLGNLAESSAIEQDADVVFIIRPDKERKSDDRTLKPKNFFVPKQRGGESEVVLSFDFQSTYCRFVENIELTGTQWTGD